MPIPALRVEFGLDDDIRYAMHERRDDAITHARHPSRVGGAPEAIVIVQIEREKSCRVMRDHGVVNMQDALRPAGCPAGEMQERDVFRIGGGYVENGQRPAHQVAPGKHAFAARLGVDENDMFEFRQAGTQGFDLAPVERLRCDEDARLADLHARGDGLGTEGGEQRRNDAFGLQRAENGDVEFRNAPEQNEDRVSRPCAQ